MCSCEVRGYQAVLYPAMLELSDVPNRHELAEQLRKVSGIAEPTPEEAVMQQQIDMLKLQLANKAEELELKAAELALKAQQIDVTARLKAEDIVSRMGPKVPPPQRQPQKQ